MKQKNVKHAHLPLIPDVALVEFPPKNADLSNITTDPPFSNIVCAAERPARPPPMTMTFLFVSFIISSCVFLVSIVADDGKKISLMQTLH